MKVGVDLIAHYANEFGLGRATGISLPHEKPGIVPSSSWKKKRFGVPWYSGETLSFSVGQGYLNATPLQLLMLISGVANGGKLYLPQVVEKVENIYGNKLKEYPPVELGRANVSEKTLQIVQEALRGAVNDPHGTGWTCALKDVKVAGKTGTAQVVRMPENFKKGDMNRMPLKFRDHAWFVAYAPFEDPKISIAVLVEHGGFGASAAAPIAKKVIEKYLNLEPSPPLKTAEKESDSGLCRLIDASSFISIGLCWGLSSLIASIGILNLYSATAKMEMLRDPALPQTDFLAADRIGGDGDDRLHRIPFLFGFRLYRLYGCLVSFNRRIGLRHHHLRCPAMGQDWVPLFSTFGVCQDLTHLGAGKVFPSTSPSKGVFVETSSLSVSPPSSSDGFDP